MSARRDLAVILRGVVARCDRARASGDAAALCDARWHVVATHGAALAVCGYVECECAAWAAGGV